MNDADEDADVERELNARMRSISGLLPPRSTFVAPAALYLTAILEYVPFISAIHVSMLTRLC